MECVNCKTVNNDISTYCTNCGELLDTHKRKCCFCESIIDEKDITCNNCKAYVRSNYSLCTNCGTEVSDEFNFCPMCQRKNVRLEKLFTKLSKAVLSISIVTLVISLIYYTNIFGFVGIGYKSYIETRHYAYQFGGVLILIFALIYLLIITTLMYRRIYNCRENKVSSIAIYGSASFYTLLTSSFCILGYFAFFNYMTSWILASWVFFSILLFVEILKCIVFISVKRYLKNKFFNFDSNITSN